MALSSIRYLYRRTPRGVPDDTNWTDQYGYFEFIFLYPCKSVQFVSSVFLYSAAKQPLSVFPPLPAINLPLIQPITVSKIITCRLWTFDNYSFGPDQNSCSITNLHQVNSIRCRPCFEVNIKAGVWCCCYEFFLVHHSSP